MGIARHYQSDRNPGEAALSGVPLGDIDEETWARLPAWMQASVDAWTVDGRKVYLMSHRAAPDETPEPAQAEVKPKSKKTVTPPDEPVAVPDEPETEPPPSDEPPADELSMTEGMV